MTYLVSLVIEKLRIISRTTSFYKWGLALLASGIETINTRTTTTYLKGIAILAVLVDHFFKYYEAGNYDWVAEYANGLIAFFFLFSGYGIYFSLEKSFSKAGYNKHLFLRYYYGRFIRIYPLYWLALFITPFFQPGYDKYERLHQLTVRTVLDYAGFPFVHAPRIFWFVTAIIQCYFVAPFIYLVLRKVKIQIAIFYNAAALAIFFLISLIWLTDILVLPYIDKIKSSYMYHHFFLANILLFSLGMLMPLIIDRYRSQLVNKGFMFFTLTLLFFSIYYTRFDDLLFTHSEIFLGLPFIISAFSFCLSILAINPSLPFKRLLTIPGRHSYPIYLFHLAFFGFLAQLDLISNGSIGSVFIMVSLLPVFLLFCFLIERGSDSIRMRAEIVARKAGLFD